MIYALLSVWVLCVLLILKEKRVARVIIYMTIFSLVSSVSYLFLSAPDVAMAEAAISAFTTVFFIICFERYFSHKDKDRKVEPEKRKSIVKILLPIAFTVAVFGLFIYVVPSEQAAFDLPGMYISRFMYEVGGENAVTAVLLDYRIYDTLFEALIIVVGVVAVIHLSYKKKLEVKSGLHSSVEKDGMAVFAIKIICPIMVLFGIYLVMNGHISPGGGFQGGLAIASFFVCRYLIYDVYDLPIKKLGKMEEVFFAGLVIVAIFIVFLGVTSDVPEAIRPFVQTGYLLAVNALIGLKVACGFIILFYRYIAVERRK